MNRPNTVLLTSGFLSILSIGLYMDLGLCVGGHGKAVSADKSGRKRVGGLRMGVACHRHVIIFGFALLFTFSASRQTWRQVGPPGGDVQSLATAPGNASTLFLGVSDGQVFGLRDGGKSWGEMDRPVVDSTLSALSSRQAGNQLVAASSKEGLFVLDMGSASSASADPVSASPTGRQ